MAINLKSQQEIDCMRTAGQLAAEVLDLVPPFVSPNNLPAPKIVVTSGLLIISP